MRAVLVSRFPRVDTPEWKRTVAEGLLAAGFELAVLYSRSTLADQAAAGLREDGLRVVTRYVSLRRGQGPTAAPAPTLAAWAEDRGLPVIRARRLDDARALAAVRHLAPGLLVLAGADIVPGSLLAIPSVGTINAHYGLLPAYRGMNVTEWSVFNGDPPGVSVHLVDEGIDTGDILLREPIAPAPDDTLAGLRVKQRAVAARLLVQAAIALRDGAAQRTPQDSGDGRQYYRMHPRLREVAERRLRAQAGAG